MVNTNQIHRRADQSKRRGWAAFTLIELLVVIAVIGLLAGLVVGGASRAGRAGREARIRAEMARLTLAIESYKEAIGSYPPDNVVNPAVNPLFYELVGTVVDHRDRSFRTKDRSEAIRAETINQFFRIPGFANAAEEPSRVRRFIELTSKQYAEISSAPNADVEVLVVPVSWPPNAAIQPVPGRPGVNPWRYLAGVNATNNGPDSFDLWAEYVDGRQVKIICNWSKDVLVKGTL